MQNSQISAIFDEIADILEIQGEDGFRIRSYRNAARTVRDCPESLEDLAADVKRLRALPGIGQSIAEQIQEIVHTGTSHRLTELRGKVPAHVTELMHVSGLGPKKAKLIHEKLGISTIDELARAAQEHRLRGLPLIGEKTEEKIARGLRILSQTSRRITLKDSTDQARALARHIQQVPGLVRWEVAGSFRRRSETIADLDILIEAKDRAKTANAIAKYKAIGEVMQKGAEKLTIRLDTGLQVDFRFCDGASYGAALLYFTGSKAHNISLRRIAVKKGWKLNEYGLFAGVRRIAGATEEDMYRKLGLPYIPPELREDRGEVDAAQKGKLPHLVEVSDIRGDLHSHTKETDGRASLEEMVDGASARGREYIAITDHSKAVTIARGMDETRLRRHADRIRALARSRRKIRILAGVEVDILKDGSLDIDRDLLQSLDWVTASIHSHFEQDEKTMTRRILAAIESGVVDAISHPFARQIGRRDSIRFDAGAVFEACRKHGVSLEVNCYPDRLDLSDIYCKRAKERGVTMTISTDAHKVTDLDFIEFGVAVARRGWLERKDVRNALPAVEFLKTLRHARTRSGIRVRKR